MNNHVQWMEGIQSGQVLVNVQSLVKMAPSFVIETVQIQHLLMVERTVLVLA